MGTLFVNGAVFDGHRYRGAGSVLVDGPVVEEVAQQPSRNPGIHDIVDLRGPLAADLDGIVPDRPAYLRNRDHHGVWVNTRALDVAGVHADTPDPADGHFDRDGAGAPSGTLHEGAMGVVGRLLPETDQRESYAGLLEGQRYLHSLGVTGWQDAILGAYGGHADPAPTTCLPPSPVP